MKAIVYREYGPPDVLRLEEVEQPVPKADDVLIKVHATSVNDWDWALVIGKPFIMRMLGGLTKPKINILGTEVAGIVVAVGSGVKSLKAGDAVYGDLSESGFGAWAEYVCAKESALVIKPTSMSFEDATALPHAAALAIQGLEELGKIQKGQKILINGAGGGVGTLGVQIAKKYGCEVTGVDKGDKLEMMLTSGYDHVIDYQKEDFTKNGILYDIIFDTKTTRAPGAYLRSLNKTGTYVTVGGDLPLLFRTIIRGKLISLFSKKRLLVLGLKPNKGLSYVNELYEAGKIKPVIEGPYSLAEIPEAVQLFGDAKHKGKIVVSVGR
ncbi:MAG: NAD(P)-dependent alcohol dehydrogenase [Flavobacteriales bacterium]|nr:NAD(P)-dependent alcohol dehydrogenase [Flavobacteriales bacterium]